MEFKKSSFSPVEGGGGPTCVEVAETPGAVFLRDSKKPEVVLEFSRAEWGAFLQGVKNREFDL